MREQGHGRLIQNSSVLGFAALRFRGAYNATKFALEGLSDTLRLELKDSEIKVILLSPARYVHGSDKTAILISSAGLIGNPQS